MSRVVIFYGLPSAVCCLRTAFILTRTAYDDKNFHMVVLVYFLLNVIFFKKFFTKISISSRFVRIVVTIFFK